MLEKQQKTMSEVKKLMDELTAKEQVEAGLKKQLVDRQHELHAKKKAWIDAKEAEKKAIEEAKLEEERKKAEEEEAKA